LGLSLSKSQRKSKGKGEMKMSRHMCPYQEGQMICIEETTGQDVDCNTCWMNEDKNKKAGER
jgi:hypothetical protein